MRSIAFVSCARIWYEFRDNIYREAVIPLLAATPVLEAGYVKAKLW